MDWLKCNICFNTYNDSNLRPRVLSCGHSFCEICLENTIQNNTLTCPQCRKIHDTNSVAELPINFVLEGLLKSLTPCSQIVKEGAISGPIAGQGDQESKNEANENLKFILEQEKSLPSQKGLLKASSGVCSEHPSNELIFRCSSHKCWVCEKCIEERGDHPKNYCTITSFKEEIEDRKKVHKISLDNEEKLCDETFLVIEKHISYLSEKREHNNSLLGILQDLENLHKTEDKNLQSEIKSFEKVIENGKLLKQSLLDAKAIILLAETLDESIAARDMVENNKQHSRNWLKRTQVEVNEGKLNVESSIILEMAEKISLEYREKMDLLQEKFEDTITLSAQNIPLESETLKDIELMSKSKSGISEISNEEVCNSHNKLIELRCFICKRWICEDCLNSHTTVTGCLTISSSIALKYMKDEQMESTNVLLSYFEEDTNYLFSKVQKLNDNIQEITDKKKELSEKAAEHDTEIKKIQNVLYQGKKLKGNIVKSKKHLSSTNSLKAVMVNIEVLDEMNQSLRSWAIINLGMDNSDDGFSHNIHKYDRLQSHIPSYPLVFIELSLGNTVKGRITIKLDANLPNIREYIVHIVTGKNRLSLVGTELDYCDGESIGTENLSFSELLVIPDRSEIVTCETGDVVSFYDKCGMSSIYFHVDKYDCSHEVNRSNFRVIGSIVTGLDILIECYDNHSNGVKISNCGIVLG